MLYDFYLFSSEGDEVYWLALNSRHGREKNSPPGKLSPDRTYRALAKKLKGTGARLSLLTRPTGSYDTTPWELVERLRLELPEL